MGAHVLFGRHVSASHHDSDQPHAPDEFTFRSVRDGDSYRVALAGELDLLTGRQLEDELYRLEATNAHELVLDLSGLRFIDSVAIGVIIRANTRSRSHGKRLVILRGPDSVHRPFELIGLATRLPFVDRTPAVAARSEQNPSQPRP